MADLIIYGAGPSARLMRYYLAADSTHHVVAFTTGSGERPDEPLLDGLPVLSVGAVLGDLPPSGHQMLVAVEPGTLNAERERAFEHARELGYPLASYVSTRACVAHGVPLGDNCIILEGVVIQPFAEVGDDVTIEPGCHVGHESIIGSHAYLGARTVVSGNVTIGARSRLGPNATVRNSVALAPDTLVGPGGSVLKATQPMHEYRAPDAILLATRSDEAGEAGFV